MSGRPKTSLRTARDSSAETSYASSAGVRSRMQLQRTRDTAPELAVRRILHSMGLRYRVDSQPLQDLRRRADVVFGPTKVAVFIDGCFWHGCPQHSRKTTTANPEYWSAKIERNRRRDADTDVRLNSAGWTVIRVWEHESADEVATRVASAVRDSVLRRSTNAVAPLSVKGRRSVSDPAGRIPKSPTTQ